MTSYDTRPIGIFDSGLGGLTSVRETEHRMPGENIIYFGDTGRVPYGTRSPETITKYAFDDLNFLLCHNIKAILIACGTVSSIALEALAGSTDVPVIGVVKPASGLAVRLSTEEDVPAERRGRIAVLGTPATARNGAYAAEIGRISPACTVLPVGCPLFVPLVENGYVGEDDPIALLCAKEYVTKLKDFSPACIILGCTHYPLLRRVIEKAALEILGYAPKIVDSGASAVSSLEGLLSENGLRAPDGSTGKSEFFVSDEPQGFVGTASAFLGRKIETVTRIDIDAYRTDTKH